MAKKTNLKFEAIKSILRVFLNECFSEDEIKKDKSGEIARTCGRHEGGIASSNRNPQRLATTCKTSQSYISK